METQNRNSGRCNVCIIGVHRASFLKDLKSKKHLENEKTTRSNFFDESSESNITKQNIYNPETLKEIAREKK